MPVIEQAVPTSLAQAGVDADEVVGLGRRLHLVHGAAGRPPTAFRCAARALAGAPRTRGRSCGSTTRRSRSPTASTRSRSSAARTFLSRYGGPDLLGVVLPEADRAVARGPRGLRRGARLRRGDRLDRVVDDRRPTAARPAPPATRRCGRPTTGCPSVDYFEAAYPGFTRRRRSSGTVFAPLGTRGGHAPARAGAARSGCRDSVAVAVGNVDSFVSLPGAGVERPGRLRDGRRDLDLRHGRRPREVRLPGITGVVRRRHPSRALRLRGRAGRGRRHARVVRRRPAAARGQVRFEAARSTRRPRSRPARPGWSRSTGGTGTARSSPTPI